MSLRTMSLATAAVSVALLVSGCSAASGEEPQSTVTPSFLPGVSPPPQMVNPLGSILILRAYSGKFSHHEERTLVAEPEVAVFDDGLVVANVALVSEPPDYREVMLTEEQMSKVMASLEGADLQALAAGKLAGGDLCFDCATTIIRTDIGGETIEIAAEGLLTVDAHWASGLPYSPSLIATDRLLNELADLVRDGPSEPYAGPLPQIPVAPLASG